MHNFPPPRPPHPRPRRPEPAREYLLQRLIASQKRSVPCLRAEWCFDRCETGSIQSVRALGTPEWALENDCRLRIALPLSVQLRDARGCTHTCPARLDVDTDLPSRFVCSMEEPGTSLLILPCVSLVCAECAGAGRYRVQLQTALEICLVRYEICRCAPAAPECPQLPLYPPPMC